MSRGFVKETDREEIPILSPRAHLPAGAVNYVTPNGLKELEAEQESLQNERKRLCDLSVEANRVQINYIDAKLNQLLERINSAQVVDPKDLDRSVVRIGAKVKLRNQRNLREATFQIVGVDEADMKKGKLSYLSPLAGRLMNRSEGEIIDLETPGGLVQYEIRSLVYD